MASRALRLAALAAMFAGCRDIPTPPGGVQALGRVILPSPGLVVGDTLRDSLGNVTPLRIVAFDQNGDTLAALPDVRFFLLDTTAVLDGDILVGRSTGDARIVATVAGLQSRIDTLTVTLRPDSIVPADSTRSVRSVALTDSSYASNELAVIVQHRDGTDVSGVDAVIVTYSLTRSPAGHPAGSGPTVVFAGGSTSPVRDTTAAGGRAGRTIRLRTPALPQLPDSAIVTASASYRGQTLGTVHFTIVFQTQ